MSKRLILFSQPTPAVWEKLAYALFPDYLTERLIAYLPSEGDSPENPKYTPIWQQFADSNGAKLVYVDNSKRGDEAKVEMDKLIASNILMITGGNTFKLLNHLRLSGLDKAIVEFWKKKNVVVSGFSAGAIVLSPRIDIASQPATDLADDNSIGLVDLTGLNIVDFEIWPHFNSQLDQEVFGAYKQSCPNAVQTVSDEELIIIDK